MGFDKKVHDLPQQPAYRENLTEEIPVYFTRAFHQMHCIVGNNPLPTPAPPRA
jgi:hypothetical protein